MEQKGLKKKLADNKNTVIIAATFALVVVACIFAVYLRLYTGKELWYEMFAAIIGVIITAIITMMLLVGQTDSDEKREKRGKVFEKKLQIYNEYLDTLCNVVKDGKGTDEEKLRLAFSTSAVAMHCAPERIETVSRCVKEIFRIVISKNDSKNKRLTKDEWTRQLLNNLFEVMEAFRADLYQDIKGRGQAEWKTTINNFTEAFVYNTESDEGNGSAPDTEPAAAGAATSAEEEWAEAKKKWAEDGWSIEDNLKDGDHFKLSLPGTEGYVYVGIYEGHYYVKTAWQSDPNFSKALKWDNGGRRSYGTGGRTSRASISTFHRARYTSGSAPTRGCDNTSSARWTIWPTSSSARRLRSAGSRLWAIRKAGACGHGTGTRSPATCPTMSLALLSLTSEPTPTAGKC